MAATVLLAPAQGRLLWPLVTFTMDKQGSRDLAGSGGTGVPAALARRASWQETLVIPLLSLDFSPLSDQALRGLRAIV